MAFPRESGGEDCWKDAPIVWNNKVYFIAQGEGDAGLQLWTTDGTPAGTVPLGGVGRACDLTQANNRLYFSVVAPSIGRMPWVSDGTRAGTVPLDLPAGVLGGYSFKAVGSNVYFRASDATRGAELWRIDASGNVAFAIDIVPGPEGSSPTPLGEVNGRLLLVVQRAVPANSREMWISDGTPAGTTQLATLAGTGKDPMILNGKGYFERSGADGVEIWVTDGTSAGTMRLADTSPNADAGADWFADFHGVTVFKVSNPEATQLWRTDGTPAGTKLISSKVPGGPSVDLAGSLGFRDRLAVGPRFFFGANVDAIGPELYALTNDLPTATADTASSSNGAAVTINVVSNDSDGDGLIDPGTVRIWTAPANGTAVATANGSIIYTPNPGFGGTDTFSYVVNDNQRGTSAPATVTVNVTAAPTVTTTGKRGGGGALGFAELLVFLALLTFRTTRRTAEE
jgi:ELWxxDGT repeat protein